MWLLRVTSMLTHTTFPVGPSGKYRICRFGITQTRERPIATRLDRTVPTRLTQG